MVVSNSQLEPPPSKMRAGIATEARHRLDVMSLREHIIGSHRVKKITVRYELFEVASQRGRIAGDIRDFAGLEGQDAADNIVFRA